ncbi:hypothetical protein MJO28_013526 [Puccinia striiformis f. sp. tritici]|uniref:Uncharacterized protein n=3 Tax=Puccinia striiformis TaxID=27350 RepID=A0A2S4UAR3_9BASI|nr:hypothetical protein MJO28_013526 [Puccinia striiformis f. sp. tritici]POV94360.1 hypothetical protein PSHT_16284 [Puccinia striiformis]
MYLPSSRQLHVTVWLVLVHSSAVPAMSSRRALVEEDTALDEFWQAISENLNPTGHLGDFEGSSGLSSNRQPATQSGFSSSFTDIDRTFKQSQAVGLSPQPDPRKHKERYQTSASSSTLPVFPSNVKQDHTVSSNSLGAADDALITKINSIKSDGYPLEAAKSPTGHVAMSRQPRDGINNLLSNAMNPIPSGAELQSDHQIFLNARKDLLEQYSARFWRIRGTLQTAGRLYRHTMIEHPFLPLAMLDPPRRSRGKILRVLSCSRELINITDVLDSYVTLITKIDELMGGWEISPSLIISHEEGLLEWLEKETLSPSPHQSLPVMGFIQEPYPDWKNNPHDISLGLTQTALMRYFSGGCTMASQTASYLLRAYVSRLSGHETIGMDHAFQPSVTMDHTTIQAVRNLNNPMTSRSVITSNNNIPIPESCSHEANRLYTNHFIADQRQNWDEDFVKLLRSVPDSRRPVMQRYSEGFKQRTEATGLHTESHPTMTVHPTLPFALVNPPPGGLHRILSVLSISGEVKDMKFCQAQYNLLISKIDKLIQEFELIHPGASPLEGVLHWLEGEIFSPAPHQSLPVMGIIPVAESDQEDNFFDKIIGLNQQRLIKFFACDLDVANTLQTARYLLGSYLFQHAEHQIHKIATDYFDFLADQQAKELTTLKADSRTLVLQQYSNKFSERIKAQGLHPKEPLTMTVHSSLPFAMADTPYSEIQHKILGILSGPHQILSMEACSAHYHNLITEIDGSIDQFEMLHPGAMSHKQRMFDWLEGQIFSPSADQSLPVLETISASPDLERHFLDRIVGPIQKRIIFSFAYNPDDDHTYKTSFYLLGVFLLLHSTLHVRV